MQIEISTRHGDLGPEEQAHLQEKAEKLVKYFGRLMAIEVAVDQVKHTWNVEIRVSAEHKHDFVASESGPTASSAMDQCVHKIEQQLRKYKERVQNHKGDGGLSTDPPSLPAQPDGSAGRIGPPRRAVAPPTAARRARPAPAAPSREGEGEVR